MEKTKHHSPTEEASVVIPQVAQEYLHAQNCSPKTIAVRRQAIAHLQRFLNARGCERLADATTGDLEAWRRDLQQRNFAPASQEVFCRSVRQLFNWLEQAQRLFVNPAAGFIVPRPSRPVLPVLTVAQVQQLLSQTDPDTTMGLRDRALLATLYATGITPQELLLLHCRDVSSETMMFGGKKRRTLPLDAMAAEALTQYLTEARPALLGKKSSCALWLTNRGEALTHSALQQIVRRYSKDAELGDVTSAALRRACTVHRWQAGMHPLELQLFLGYASLQTLCQYLRVSVTELFRPHNETRHETVTPA